MRLKELEGRKGIRDSVAFDPAVIVVEEGHNPRNYDLPENRAHLDELKGSIREHGVLQPLWVRQDGERVILVDGECRLRAVRELIAEGVQIESVPTTQVKGGNEAERLILALTANTGKSLSKWEVGAAYTKLIGYGWSEDKIAQKMGQSSRFVKEAIELSDAPEEMKHLLSQQAVTPSLALSEIRKNGASAAVVNVKARVAASNGVKVARAKAEPKMDLMSAIRILIAEADTQRDAMVVELHRDTVNAVREALR